MQPRLSTVRFLSLLVAVFTVLAACGTSNNETADPGDTAAPTDADGQSPDDSDTEPADVGTIRVVKAQTSLLDMPLRGAQTADTFGDYGLEIDLLEFDSGSDAGAAFNAGEADLFGPVGLQQAVLLQGEDRDVVAIVSTSNKYFYVLTALPDSEVESTADLAGRTVGVSGFGASTDLVTRWALAQQGIDPEQDTEIIAVGGVSAMIGALDTNQVDAGMLIDPVATQRITAGDVKVVEPDFREIDWPVVFIAPRSFVESNGDAVQAFVSAIATSAERIRTDDDFWHTVYDEHFRSLSDAYALEGEALEALKDTTQASTPEWGQISEESYEDPLLEIMVQGGQLESLEAAPEYSEVTDTSFLDAFIQSTGG